MDRKKRIQAKRKASKMRTPEELMVVLGIGRNQTYEALQQGKIKGAFRIGRRWLIPDAVIDRLMSGETAA
jgi:excisionase family DNA binding protein